MNTDAIDKICRRQTARLLGHLRRTQQLSTQLESDIVRGIGFAFSDVKTLFMEKSKDIENEHHPK
jgi:hypothetical protein